jgi:hypothetical protein
MEQLAKTVLVTGIQFRQVLEENGCTCEWGLPVELDEEETITESEKDQTKAYYHLLFIIPPEFIEITGYPHHGIGIHIDHIRNCPVQAQVFSRFN